MGCAVGFSLQEDLNQSISIKEAQLLLLDTPIYNIYQPKTIESTSICNSLKWCDDDDNLENLFEECRKLEQDEINANVRILKKDENQVQEIYQISQQSKTYSQTSICLKIRRNLFIKHNKQPDRNQKIPNSILKRQHFKEGQGVTGKIKSKMSQQKIVRFSKCYVKVIPEISIQKSTIDFLTKSRNDLNNQLK
ncbi:unnamed protein product [Paramecium sonneborni]|uniref:Uncharacterized protein n=1 Tax=Paramecium sonneborni TaxID=65129 RepID=A0A8S1MEI8_9CILI|nr:unnamed protein product [Paramecium sonneborni]